MVYPATLEQLLRFVVTALSTLPLQSLSSPSHTSVLACVVWLHFSWPLPQASAPFEQTPWGPVLQGWRTPAGLLSITPLQSLSSPSQTSCWGFWRRKHEIVPPEQ